ncbi:hypothetical protein SELMODRAFT_414081 [Selaginella moellendorffii]|uniref:Uncharacterized protein n=1 Tax=Selaginella moellendorffii TaxID=88036 RepID=D8RRK6_SELML|nr:hypothetical protein SELMODRAFT_414081 [Selaginella moellendorffii]
MNTSDPSAAIMFSSLPDTIGQNCIERSLAIRKDDFAQSTSSGADEGLPGNLENMHVKYANKMELEAAREFFAPLLDELVKESDGELKAPSSGWNRVADVLRHAGKRVIWLVDDASRLTEIFHTSGFRCSNCIGFDLQRQCRGH